MAYVMFGPKRENNERWWFRATHTSYVNDYILRHEAHWLYGNRHGLRRQAMLALNVTFTIRPLVFIFGSWLCNFQCI